MPKKKLTKEELNASIEKAKTEIRQGENLVKQLTRQCSQMERKVRTRRLIERGAIAESLIDGADTLTNEQFQTLLSAGLHTGAARELLTFFKRSNSISAAGLTPDAE
jgi:Skp family chaperone for outer membrane proteins